MQMGLTRFTSQTMRRKSTISTSRRIGITVLECMSPNRLLLTELGLSLMLKKLFNFD